MNRTVLKSKHSCEFGTAKQFLRLTAAISLLWLFLPLWWLGNLFAQSVQVKTIGADYTNRKVTFSVSWAAGSRNATHLGKVWVFIDYQEMNNPNIPVGSWQRAPVAGISTSAGTVSGNNGKGFYLQGTNAAFSATVTVTLSGMPAKFNWCAYATDYPPNAVIKAGGGYTLRGTPPFAINGVVLGNNVTSLAAGTCITSISDATGCSGLLPTALTLSTSNPAAVCAGTGVTLKATASGGTTTAMTYTWNAGGVVTTTTTNSFAVPAAAIPASTTFSVSVRNANNCVSSTVGGSITVNPSPTLASMVANPTTICAGGTSTLTITATGAASYSFDNGGSWQATNTKVISPSANTAYTARIRTSAKCEATGKTATVAVVADPTVTIGSAQTICYNTAGSALTATVTGGNGANTYTWQHSADNTTWTDAGTSTAITLATGKLTANRYYRVMTTQATNGCASTYSGSVLKTVRANFTTGAILATGQTLCIGGTPGNIGNSAAASGGDGSITYQWRKNGTAISGATAATYTPPASDATAIATHTYTRWAKDNTCHPTLAQSTGSWVLKVIADPTVSVTAAQTICYNTQPAVMTATVSGGSGTTKYQWQTNASGSWANVSGATAATYRPGKLTATTGYRVAVTQSASGCAVTSGGINQTVRANFSAGAILTTGHTLCVGGTPNSIGSTTPASGGDGSITYEWRKNGTAINGATAATYAPPASDATAVAAHTYTRWAKDNTCHPTLAQSTGSWVLKVIADPTVSITAAQTICYNTQPAAMTATVSGGSGTTACQWQTNASGSWANVSGATAATYRPGKLTATTGYRVAVTQSASGCAVTSGSINQTVRANFSAGAILTTGHTLCVGGTPNSIGSTTAASGGDGTITYEWRKNGTAISGATAATYAPPASDATAVAAHTYTRWAKDNTCNTTLAQSTGSWVLKVIADPSVSITAAQTICANTQPAAMTATVSGGSGTTKYQWQTNASGNWVNVSGATATTYRPGMLTATTGYRVTVTQSVAGCAATSGSINKTVNALPTAPTGLTASPSTMCAGGARKVTLTASGGANNSGAVFQFGTGTTVGTTPAGTTTAATYDIASTTATGFWVRRQGTTCATSTAGKTLSITVTSPAANGQAKNACGCANGTTDCSGTCKTTGTYTQQDGACHPTSCKVAYTRQFNQCGVLQNATHGTYTNAGCTDECPPAGSVRWTTCSGFKFITNATYDPAGALTQAAARNICTSKGMRLPSTTEGKCICTNRETLPGGYVLTNYWTNDPGDYGQRWTESDCGIASYSGKTSYFRCVK